MTIRVGTVTIGQSPRVDVTPDLLQILGPGFELVEAGALDGLTREQIAAMAPNPDDYVLVSRLTDGTSVQFSKRAVEPLVEQKIAEHFKSSIQIVLLLCTGEFPELNSSGLLIRPQPLLFNVVKAVLPPNAKLGIFTPSPDQVERSTLRWSQISEQTRSLYASPYINPKESIPAAAEEFSRWGAELMVMDCIGYSLAMKEQVRKITGKPVITGRSIAARVLAELA